MKEFQITENEAGQRFDKYLAKLLRNAPKSLFYKMHSAKKTSLMAEKQLETKSSTPETRSDCFSVMKLFQNSVSRNRQQGP